MLLDPGPCRLELFAAGLNSLSDGVKSGHSETPKHPVRPTRICKQRPPEATEGSTPHAKVVDDRG
jgi:hypothetical protein